MPAAMQILENSNYGRFEWYVLLFLVFQEVAQRHDMKNSIS